MKRVLAALAAVFALMLLTATSAGATRTDDYSPYWGADQIHSYVAGGGYTGCTDGFPLRAPDGTYWTITAAHCGPLGSRWYVPDSGAYMGAMAKVDVNVDIALVQLCCGQTEQGDLYSDPGPFYYRQVYGSVNGVAVGTHLCSDGSITGEHCDQVMIGTRTERLSYGGAQYLENFYLMRNLNGGACAPAPGDSGSPVYEQANGSGAIYAVGIVINESAGTCEVAQMVGILHDTALANGFSWVHGKTLNPERRR